ncbi:UNKNOWN [Stylonychia lemnae]|uniref:Uncharacterized protein n=1 Tax=Stylonychia lemnae TaxID=5949 RepID=A0A078ADP5_STYLE|nr:UNKNOWN [Stylonychia lemnae]|eukprot:CDW80355.1 UNKNOWN [Stylonychia lemnae]
MIVICFGWTFDLVQNAIVQNQDQFDVEIKNSIFFQIFVSRGVQTALEINYLICGISQAVSFLHKCQGNASTLYDCFQFIIKRLFKLVPIYYITFFLTAYGVKYFGQGPLWHYFDKVLEPCQNAENVMANLLIINNFYPQFGEDKSMCMPWTWFVPIYLQMSIITPFVIYFMQKSYLICIPIQVVVIALGTLIVQGVQIAIYDTGISPVFDKSYWNQIYTKPWFFINIHIGLGVLFGMFLKNHMDIIQRLDLGGRYENSLSYTALTYIKKMYVIRLLLILIGLVLWIGFNHLLGYKLMSLKESWGETAQILYGVCRAPISLIGICIILLPLMLSKFRIVRYFLISRGFIILSHLSFGIYLWYPLMVLSYLFQMHQMVTISYMSIFYYFLGSFILSILISYAIFMLVEAPIIALLNIYQEATDIKDGNKKIKFKYEFIK